MAIRFPTLQELQSFEGKNISAICPRGFNNNASSHCAHFVSHVLRIRKAPTCATMSWKSGEDTSIQVSTLFQYCANVGEWATVPETVSGCLAFITSTANVQLSSKTMYNDPKRHIGFYLASAWKIWHYDNDKDMVVSQRLDEFKFHYKDSLHRSMYWGLLP